MRLFFKIFFPALIVIAGLGGAWVLVEHKPKPEISVQETKVPPVTVRSVQQQDVNIPVPSQGLVSPKTEIQLIVESTGKILWVSPKLSSGSFFKKGDVLLEIDETQAKFELTKAKTQLGAAQEAYNRMKAELDAASADLPPGVTAPKKSSNRQLKELEARLVAAKAAMEIAELSLSKTKLRAPFDGRVLESPVGVGQLVSIGMPVAQVYTTDVAEVRLPLSDRQLSLVDVPHMYEDDEVIGNAPPVTLQMDVGGDKFYWQGQIIRSEGGIDPRNRLLYLVAQVDEPYARDPNQEGRPPLGPGRFVEAEITGKRFENVVVLPRKVLRHGSEVWLVDEEDRLEKRPVDVLHRSKDLVYIKEGLAAGERVILTPLDVAVDGMKVHATFEDGLFEETDKQNRLMGIDDTVLDRKPKQAKKLPSVSDDEKVAIEEKIEQLKSKGKLATILPTDGNKEDVLNAAKDLVAEVANTEAAKQLMDQLPQDRDELLAKLDKMAANANKANKPKAPSPEPEKEVAKEVVEVNPQETPKVTEEVEADPFQASEQQSGSAESQQAAIESPISQQSEPPAAGQIQSGQYQVTKAKSPALLQESAQ